MGRISLIAAAFVALAGLPIGHASEQSTPTFLENITVEADAEPPPDAPVSIQASENAATPQSEDGVAAGSSIYSPFTGAGTAPTATRALTETRAPDGEASPWTGALALALGLLASAAAAFMYLVRGTQSDATKSGG